MPSYLVMPPWTEEEHEEANTVLRLKPDEEVRKLFRLAGGSARFVLHPKETAEAFRRKVDGVVIPNSILLRWASVENVTLSSYAEADGDSTAIPIATYMHVFSATGSEEAAYKLASLHFGFASGFMRELVGKSLMRSTAKDPMTQLSNMVEKAECGILGSLAQSVLHYMIARGGDFEVQHLETGARHLVTFPKLQMATMEKWDDIRGPDHYYKAVPENFPSVDAVIPPTVCLQMTVAKRHGISLTGLEQALAALLQKVGRRVDMCCAK